jgi:hypothetical protein
MHRKVVLVTAAVLLAPAGAWAQVSHLPNIGPFSDVRCVVQGPSTSAVAAPGPPPLVLALAQVAGQTVCVDLSPFVETLGDKMYQLQAAGIGLGGLGTLDQISATFNTDPFITFGATTTNAIPGTVTYAFLFGTPIVPGFYNLASSSGGVSVTPGAVNNTTVSASPIGPYVSGYGTLGAVATSLNVDNPTFTAPDGATCLATTATHTCTLPLVNGGAPGFYDNLEALLTYNQDDLASVASWSGRVDLVAAVVPEPSTIALTVTGLVALVGVARRRVRTV